MVRVIVWGALAGACLWTHGAWSNIVGKTVCGVPPDEHVLVTFKEEGKWNAYRPGWDHYREGYETEEEAIGRDFLYGRSRYGLAQFVCQAIVTPRPAYTFDAMPGKLYRLGVKVDEDDRFLDTATRERVSVTDALSAVAPRECGRVVAFSPPATPRPECAPAMPPNEHVVLFDDLCTRDDAGRVKSRFPQAEWLAYCQAAFACEDRIGDWRNERKAAQQQWEVERDRVREQFGCVLVSSPP